MPILKTSSEKVGSKTVIHVDMPLNEQPVFPPACPCCVERLDEGAFIVATCDRLPPVPFPSCKICARHTTVEDRISSIVGPGFLALTVLIIAGVLIYRGASNVGSAGATGGWQAFGALANLRFPFLGPINAAVTLACGAVVQVVLFLIYGAVMYPVLKVLSKSSCRWFEQSVRTKRHYDRSAGDCRRFVFENPAYASRFVEANSPAKSEDRSLSG